MKKLFFILFGIVTTITVVSILFLRKKYFTACKECSGTGYTGSDYSMEASGLTDCSCVGK